MAMNYTSEQIDLMDRIFEYYFSREFIDRKIDTPSCKLFAKLYKTDKDYAQTIINKVCEIGHEQGILVRQKFNYGSSEIVTMDRIKCENFKNQGGFKHYFNEPKESDVRQNIYVEANYGQIFQQGHQSSITQNESNNTQSKNKLSWLQIIAWIIAILVGIIGIYEFISKVLRH
jgi:hypothetical protein